MRSYNYGTAMLAAFEYLLDTYPEVFVIGQGLWSPWYVGNSMTDLDKKYGVERIIDTPAAMEAVKRIEGWRALGDNVIETIINKSEKVKATKKAQRIAAAV